MKRLLAIFFLLLLLFNTIGYRLYFYYAQQIADKILMALLESEAYDPKELLLIKAPLSLPYQTDWKDFERVNGEIEINGKTYEYVKRKVVNDTLFLLCLPNHHKTRLQNAKDDFFKLVNCMQSQVPEKNTNNSGKVSFFNILSDFDNQQSYWLLQSCRNNKNSFNLFCISKHISPSIPIPVQPPDLQKT